MSGNNKKSTAENHHGEHGLHPAKAHPDLGQLKQELADLLGQEILADLEKFTTFSEEELEKFIATKIEHFQTLGGWENQTADLEKVQGVQLLMATGGDFRFYRTHQQMAALYDAAAELSGGYERLTTKDILEMVNNGADGIDREIITYPVDSTGKYTSGRGIDLYDYAHIMRIRDFLDSMHPEDLINSGMDDRTKIKEKYLAGEDLIIRIALRDNDGNLLEGGNTYSLNLRVAVQRPVVTKEQFDYYYRTIEDSQAFLQAISTFKESSISGKHSENGGHVYSQYGLGGKLLFLPTSPKLANEGVLSEVNKGTASGKAQGHVHEFGWYEENTGICVRFDANRLKIFRGDVKGPSEYGSTNGRTKKNLLGLGSKEAAMYNAGTRTFHFGKKVEKGRTLRGGIYEAMHNHYDTQMEGRRGYKLTEAEAGDKILTDVVGLHFAIAPVDWILNFGVETDLWGPKVATERGIVKEYDSKGEPKLVFFAKLPSGFSEPAHITDKTSVPLGSSDRYGEITFHGITAFARYLEWRRLLGDLPGAVKPISESIVTQIGGKKDENNDKNKVKDATVDQTPAQTEPDETEDEEDERDDS